MARRKTENRNIEVILLQNDKHLGEKFEIVKVRPIFARNVLFVKNIAVMADIGNKNKFAQKMKAAEHDRSKKVQGLEELFMKMQQDGGIVITKKANKENTLYAKIDENEISEMIKQVYGIILEPHYIKLKKKLTAIGQFTVPFLYKDIKKDFTVIVKKDISEEKTKNESDETNKNDVGGEKNLDEKKVVKKTKEEIKAEKEAQKKKDKAEKIKTLKGKYK
ncbi:MAG: 50S ribosomal protein L9 [Candidatus Absconditabacterales bacterium]